MIRVTSHRIVLIRTSPKATRRRQTCRRRAVNIALGVEHESGLECVICWRNSLSSSSSSRRAKSANSWWLQQRSPYGVTSRIYHTDGASTVNDSSNWNKIPRGWADVKVLSWLESHSDWRCVKCEKVAVLQAMPIIGLEKWVLIRPNIAIGFKSRKKMQGLP